MLPVLRRDVHSGFACQLGVHLNGVLSSNQHRDLRETHTANLQQRYFAQQVDRLAVGLTEFDAEHIKRERRPVGGFV